MRRHDWRHTFADALITGSIASVATAATAAACGARDSGSAIAPINATSHMMWGPEAAEVRTVTARHTLPGLALNEGAGIFWATLYERVFGEAADNGDTGRAIAGGVAVAALAYVTDYHLVPKRLTPGWEMRISGRSLALVYAALALALPLRGLLRSRPARRR
jgi:hypothetical protein